MTTCIIKARTKQSDKTLKRESIIIPLLFAGLCSEVYAHAGMADRMLNTMVIAVTIVLVIFITQLLFILVLRRSKRERIIKIKWKLLMLAKKLCGAGGKIP